MDELKDFQAKLSKSITSIEENWTPIDMEVFKKVDCEDGSGDRSALIGIAAVDEEEIPLERFRSWITIEEWVGQVEVATKSGYESMMLKALV